MKRFSTAMSSLCIGLTLHAQVLWAETPEALKKGAAQAAGDMFKPQLEDLYATDPDGTVTLKGNGLKPGDGELKPGQMYGDVKPMPLGGNDLPAVDTFEELAPYRDQQLNALEAGRGAYGASGRNVEPNAMAVLRGSRNLPPVKAEEFLFPSRDVVKNHEQLKKDFGDCQIITGTKVEEKTSTSTRLERCERQAYNDQPITAERTYLGPAGSFVHTVKDGKHYCSDGTRTTWVQDEITCTVLNSFDRVPAAYQILNCGVGCLDIRLTADVGPVMMPWLFEYPSFQAFCEDWHLILGSPRAIADDGTVCNLGQRIRVYEAMLDPDWYPDYDQGQTDRSYYRAVSILQYLRRISFPAGQTAGATDPFPIDLPTRAKRLDAGACGATPNLSLWGKTPYNDIALLETCDTIRFAEDYTENNDNDRTYFNANTPDQDLIARVQPNLMVLRRASDGRYYVLNRQEFLRALTSYDVPRTPDELRAYHPYIYGDGFSLASYLSYPDWWETTVGLPLETHLPAYGSPDLTPVHTSQFALKLAVGVISATAQVTAAAPQTRLTYQGTTLATGVSSAIPLPSLVNHEGRLQTFRLSYTAVPGGDPDASVARIVIKLKTQLFTPWVYLASRWTEMQQLVANGCTLTYEVSSTVSRSGCVQGWTGLLCGSSVPSPTPFTGLTDRGATKITVTPRCERPVNEGGFQTLDNCKDLRENPACSMVQTECIDDVDEAGMCYTFEDTYSCSSSLTYSTPVVTTQNICTSTIACTGEDCVMDSSTDGTLDLLDTASKLASVDMILADMNCGGPAGTPPVDGDVSKCEVFKGEASSCKRIVLGLANCCDEPKGVSLYDYLMLAFSVSKLNSLVTSLGVENAVTGAWSSLANTASATFSRLTSPITQMWEGIVGNTSTAASSFSLAGVKQALMSSVQKWTAQTFGQQASNAIFTTAVDGTVAFTGTASTILSAVSIAFTVYSVVKLVAAIVLACDKKEIELGIKRALKSTHEIGVYCSTRVLGICLSRRTSYCTFSSPLSRIMNEQIRKLSGRSWGTPEEPDCAGITLGEMASVDMDRIDLSEWTGMLVGTGLLDTSRIGDIEAMTGSTSTLGKALDQLYPRDNALERGQDRTRDADFDAIRDHTIQDFGVGVVNPSN